MRSTEQRTMWSGRRGAGTPASGETSTFAERWGRSERRRPTGPHPRHRTGRGSGGLARRKGPHGRGSRSTLPRPACHPESRGQIIAIRVDPDAHHRGLPSASPALGWATGRTRPGLITHMTGGHGLIPTGGAPRPAGPAPRSTPPRPHDGPWAASRSKAGRSPSTPRGGRVVASPAAPEPVAPLIAVSDREDHRPRYGSPRCVEDRPRPAGIATVSATRSRRWVPGREPRRKDPADTSLDRGRQPVNRAPSPACSRTAAGRPPRPPSGARTSRPQPVSRADPPRAPRVGAGPGRRVTGARIESRGGPGAVALPRAGSASPLRSRPEAPCATSGRERTRTLGTVVPTGPGPRGP